MSKNSEVKKRYSFKDYALQVSKIEQATNAINAAVSEMPQCSARDKFELSVKNLYKKIQQVSGGKVTMTDEEKELLQKFREGKITITEKTPASPIEDEKDTVPSVEKQPVNKGKKKAR